MPHLPRRLALGLLLAGCCTFSWAQNSDPCHTTAAPSPRSAHLQDRSAELVACHARAHASASGRAPFRRAVLQSAIGTSTSPVPRSPPTVTTPSCGSTPSPAAAETVQLTAKQHRRQDKRVLHLRPSPRRHRWFRRLFFQGRHVPHHDRSLCRRRPIQRWPQPRHRSCLSTRLAWRRPPRHPQSP